MARNSRLRKWSFPRMRRRRMAWNRLTTLRRRGKQNIPKVRARRILSPGKKQSPNPETNHGKFFEKDIEKRPLEHCRARRPIKQALEGFAGVTTQRVSSKG
jgi:hypothetical protein